ncbi:MAG: hypothetical protein H7A37_03750 [Chlamydiales bacterium]|nr:hypothetical protein [Chlamydiia bacterium]MCP5507400.1 hypothetical protein [Chlamydiales bacterium]
MTAIGTCKSYFHYLRQRECGITSPKFSTKETIKNNIAANRFSETFIPIKNGIDGYAAAGRYFTTASVVSTDTSPLTLEICTIDIFLKKTIWKITQTLSNRSRINSVCLAHRVIATMDNNQVSIFQRGYLTNQFSIRGKCDPFLLCDINESIFIFDRESLLLRYNIKDCSLETIKTQCSFQKDYLCSKNENYFIISRGMFEEQQPIFQVLSYSVKTSQYHHMTFKGLENPKCKLHENHLFIGYHDKETKEPKIKIVDLQSGDEEMLPEDAVTCLTQLSALCVDDRHIVYFDYYDDYTSLISCFSRKAPYQHLYRMICKHKKAEGLTRDPILHDEVLCLKLIDEHSPEEIYAFDVRTGKKLAQINLNASSPSLINSGKFFSIQKNGVCIRDYLTPNS